MASGEVNPRVGFAFGDDREAVRWIGDSCSEGGGGVGVNSGSSRSREEVGGDGESMRVKDQRFI